MIKFEKVTKQYNRIKALDDVNLTVNYGEFVFIAGPSGAGKTSLLRLIVREELPTEGEVYVENFAVTKLKRKEVPLLRRKVGYVFQDFKLLPTQTVYENVALSLEVIGRKDSEIRKIVKEILGLVGLYERRDYFPQQLSGGEKQRVAIARALVREPKILLADEPTGMIDEAAAWEIMSLLEKINSWGTTVVVATHNRKIVNSLKKRIVELNEGKIVFDSKK